MNNYNDFSPVPKYGIPDYKRDSPQWYAWLDEQLHYIINGYQVGNTTISGRLYHKLNFFHLLHKPDDGQRKEIVNPYYVDAQKDLYDLIETCYSVTKKDLVVGKGRDKGFSYDACNLALYETQYFNNNDVAVLFPSGTSQAKVQFREKYNLAWDNLVEDFKLEPGLADNKDKLIYGWEETDESSGRKSKKGALSSVSFIEVVNPDVGKSGRFKLMILEEFGEIKDPLKLITTSRANMQQGADKFGMIIAGGTSNAFNHGYSDFRELWFNADAHGFEKFFIPANKSLWGFWVNDNGEKTPFIDREGNSDMEQGEKWVLNRRKGQKDAILTIEMQNYPLTEEEMFVSINKSPFNTIYTSKQIAHIMTDKTITNQIKTGNLLMNRSKDKVEFAECRDGRWKIFAEPNDKLINKDVGAVDPYRKGQSTQSDSKGAIVIYRSFNGMNILGNLPVCIYHNKPQTKDMFFEDCLLTAMYYDCQLLFENTEDDWKDYFVKRNASKWLKARPKLGESIYTKSIEKYGVTPSVHNKASALELAIQDFDSHWENHPFVELLDDLNRFGEGNTDLAMAYLWAVLHSCDNIKRLPEFMPKKKEKKFISYVVNINGKLTVVNNPQQARMLHI